MKPDWEVLQQQFLAEHSVTGISPKEWCEIQGLNYATARRYIKKPTAQKKECANEPVRNSDIPDAQSNKTDNAQNGETELELRKYGLNDMQARFVTEYLIDLNRTAAYKRAGYKGEGNTAYVNASRLLRNAKVSKAITEALAARERRTEITQDAVLKMWWDIATADVSELTEYRRLCCRYCWGFGFNYQWCDSIEFEDAVSEAAAKKQKEPNDRGGYGYDSTLDPNPDCPRCNGAGIGRPHFHDTRDLRGASRRLFAGIKEGKFGTEVITRNQDEALKMVAQHLGMLKNRTEVTGADGGPIQSTGFDLSGLTTEQLLQLREKAGK
ncbi:terminase small subunit [Morganella morganii]|uniref:terminase small subunit n=1 Tax=Morganella morganii TaxID=582 RepID=UPI0013D1097A|nr:terminase small subunit [Morganella morganii]NGF18073.1 terminase small subunit [Morganella morganii]